ncbi:hypothetical protein GIB67_019349 [Kingdonia uniflora]|uniref:Uncharacterized protein n=1 Tax=Kingdonia uniflora TaxID=39325 RepID=A0A7J7M1J6_9MAGN|nr:hypothetical protein GIB67_019349 [Kingdonia uniflora]
MAVCTCDEGQDSYSLSLLPEKENVDPQCPMQSAFLSLLDTSPQTENWTCLDAYQNFKNSTILQIESADKYSPCSVGTDIEMGDSGMLKPCEKTVGSLMKTEGALTKALQGKISLQLGGRIMQFLMDHSIMLLHASSRDKITSERAPPDTPNSRWRRYKRSASFNSRKVGLLFSVMSIMGTLVLIFLTLRVKRFAEGLES